MKQTFLFLFFLLTTLVVPLSSYSQSTGSITVAGDFDKFYPVTFSDGGWGLNTASKLELGRSQIHENTSWRGSLMAKFEYHTTRWGNGANFIDADIVQTNNGDGTSVTFISSWKDATISNGSFLIIIWLRGGGTTYYYNSTYSQSVTVYDGVANALPYLEENGPSHSYRSEIDPYVNPNGLTKSGSAFFHGGNTNYFNGAVSIGTKDPKGYKLAVAGNMIAESVKVKLQGSWPDYVFSDDYKLPTLQETEKHIKEKGHLEGIPSAGEVKTNGIDLGEMNAKLLQKIEEITLYLIEIKKENRDMKSQILKLEKQINLN